MELRGQIRTLGRPPWLPEAVEGEVMGTLQPPALRLCPALCFGAPMGC